MSPAPHHIRPANSLTELFNLYWPLMQELNWNRAEADCKTHFTVSPQWLLVFPPDSQEPQGMILPHIYPNKTAWIAFFITTAAYRRQGLGAALWKEMETLVSRSECEFVGLDGVPEQVGTYERRGFVTCTRIHLMQRKSIQDLPVEKTWSQGVNVEIRDLKRVDAGLVARLDFEHTGLDRRGYWDANVLLAREDAVGYTAWEKGCVTGFVYARRCPGGVRVGPLYAETYEQAGQLLYKVMNDFAQVQGMFAAEIFGMNEAGRRVFEESGWEYTGASYHRMWKDGKVPMEQREGGKGARGMYAIFDAASG